MAGLKSQMIKFFKQIACLGICIFYTATSAPASIMGDNNEYIPAYGNYLKNGVTEEAFYELTDFFEDLYRPQVEALGADYWDIIPEWYNGEVGAFAMQYSRKWTITVYGGLARHRAITIDGLASVICHEIGHHLGGAPKKREVLWTGWSSLEGQADYYSSAKCFMRYIKNISKTFKDQKRYKPSAFIKEKCRYAATLHPSNDFTEQICIRSAMAAYSAEEMVRLSIGEGAISFENPDPRVVDKSDELHPNPQCRLDTLLAGILCPIDPNEEFDDEDHRVSACHADFYPEYARPKCWFNPEKY